MTAPATAENLRDAAALVVAVVRMDKAGQAAIVDHCDKDATLRCLAGLVAMTVQQATEVDDAGLLDMVQRFVESIATITDEGVQP